MKKKNKKIIIQISESIKLYGMDTDTVKINFMGEMYTSGGYKKIHIVDIVLSSYDHRTRYSHFVLHSISNVTRGSTQRDTK